MSPDTTTTTTNNNNVLDQARNFVHNAVQTPEERAKTEYGKKSVNERMMDKFLDKQHEDYSNVNKVDPPGSKAGVLETVRQDVYKATMSENEKKWNQDAEKNILEKAQAEAAQATNEVTDTVKHDDKYTQMDKEVSKEGKGPVEMATDAVGSIVQGTIDGIGSAANGAKDAVGRTANGIGSAINDSKDAVGRTANSAKDDIGSFLTGVTDTTAKTANDVREKVTGVFDRPVKQDETNAKSTADSPSATSDDTNPSKNVPEETLVDGMKNLGEKVQETANSAFEDAKAKFDERLKENSAGNTIKREDMNAGKN